MFRIFTADARCLLVMSPCYTDLVDPYSKRQQGFSEKASATKVESITNHTGGLVLVDKLISNTLQRCLFHNVLLVV